MGSASADKRKFPRVNTRFVVSYCPLERQDALDISQTKNLSIGGMAITTSAQFQPDAKLIMKVRVPSAREPVEIIGRVIESSPMGKMAVYNTRVEFLAIDEKYRQAIIDTISHNLKKT
ncbi:MAG: PilZ domain-containing protein [Planctomycetota bacterium]